MTNLYDTKRYIKALGFGLRYSVDKIGTTALNYEVQRAAARANYAEFERRMLLHYGVEPKEHKP